MPEGPEVETIVRQLKPILTGAAIVDARSYRPRFTTIPCLHISRISRHGKWIFLSLSDEQVVAINLGMSGRFVLGKQRPKHIRWEILIRSIESKRLCALRFVDPRSFGRLSLLSGLIAQQATRGDAPTKGTPLLNLGPDAMSRFMSLESIETRKPKWKEALNTGIPIKQALMDQSRLTGLGNIYAAEACFLAKVLPTRPARDLSSSELIRLIEVVPKMLHKSVAAGGTSFGDANTFRDLYGQEGSNSRNLFVYGRHGLACKHCQTKISAIVVASRSTFFCPSCQQ